MIAKAARPQVQTALAAVANALLAVAVWQGWLGVEVIGVANSVLAAIAAVLAAWYAPAVPWGAGNEFPQWIESPAADG